MKKQLALIAAIAPVLLLALMARFSLAQETGPWAVLAPQDSVGTAFTYQGRLYDGGNPASGTCDFRFRLYNDASSGSQLGEVLKGDESVTDGYFTVQLDFGAAYDGSALWLEVAVRPGDSAGSYTALAPRQALTPAPYALSLRPGAVVSGTIPGDGGAALHAINSGAAGEGLTYGLYGEATSTTGIGVLGESGAASGSVYGVYGLSRSSAGSGVYGYAHSATGTTYGVRGKVLSNGGYGVYGVAPVTGTAGIATNASGLVYGVYGQIASSSGAGVYGRVTSGGGTSTYGVYGRNDAASGVGVYGQATSGAGVYGYGQTGIGVAGASINSVGIRASSSISNPIEAYTYTFMGPSYRVFYVSNGGDVYADGGYHCGVNDGGSSNYIDENAGCMYDSSPADFAEMLPAASALEPGDVLVIGLDGQLARSTQPYQPTVVGVHSTRPSYLGNSQQRGQEGYAPLVIVGVVPVKASAENGPIQPGDLLVASSIPGHAMRAGPNPPSGVVIGKALEGLGERTGVILMLAMLQ